MTRPRTRANGEGSIYKRADGMWVAAHFLPTGKRKVLYGKTKAAVIQKLANLKVELATGTYAPVDDKTTVGDFLTKWWAEAQLNLRPGSRRTYESLLRNHLIPGLGAKLLSRLETREIELYLAERAGVGLAHRTVSILKRSSARP